MPVACSHSHSAAYSPLREARTWRRCVGCIGTFLSAWSLMKLTQCRNQAEYSTYLSWFPKQPCKVLTVASPFYGCEDRAQGYPPVSL